MLLKCVYMDIIVVYYRFMNHIPLWFTLRCIQFYINLSSSSCTRYNSQQQTCIKLNVPTVKLKFILKLEKLLLIGLLKIF